MIRGIHYFSTEFKTKIDVIPRSCFKCELGPRESSWWSRYINSEAAQIYDQYIDEGYDSTIIIMQDDGIQANLRYTQQASVATVMKVTYATFVQFPLS